MCNIAHRIYLRSCLELFGLPSILSNIPSVFISYTLSWYPNVIKCKHFPHYQLLVRRIRPSPVDSPHKGQLRRALMFSMICAWTNGWANSRDVGDLGGHSAHYDVIVMVWLPLFQGNSFEIYIYVFDCPSPYHKKSHYSDVIMGAMASQVANLTIVYSTV